ncbi:MAG TPA: hypothetical protein VJT50_11630 [Pyrinomonadaceae bacterium]|nr:hypothetical protein [Pyrinomonadaceae bacterium]
METVTGIFQTRAQAEEAVQQIHAAGIRNDRIALLTPGTNRTDAEQAVPTSDAEQPGMGKAMGGTVGGAMGVAGGASLGAAAASVLVPGVGPVIAGAILGAAILGAGGTVTGMAAGEALEEGLVKGLPHDELFLYEDAVAKGRSVVIAFTQNDELTEKARAVLANAGAESVDAARDSWWMGMRDAEAADYTATGREFSNDEPNYRRGFETALRNRGEDLAKLSSSGDVLDEAFRRGYERGCAYHSKAQENYKV